MRALVLGNKRARNATAAIALAAVLAAPGAGCGFVFSQGPPDDHTSRLTFDCGESYAPPILDTIASGLVGMAAMGSSQDQMATSSERRTNAAILGGYAVLSLASAVYGYHAVRSCRTARQRRQADWMRARVNLSPDARTDPWADPTTTAPSR